MVVIKLNFYSSPENNTNRIFLNNWRDPLSYFKKMYRDAVTLEHIWMRKPHKEIHFSIKFYSLSQIISK